MPRQPAGLELKSADKAYLETFVSTGKHSARAIKRAQVLLRRHAGQSPQATRALVEVSLASVYNIGKR